MTRLGSVALGVIADVHGNRVALEAVIADGDAVGVDRWWVLGDLVAIGPEPVPSLELIANLPHVVATRGNTDRYVVTGDRPPPRAAEVRANPDLLDVALEVESSFSWTRGALSGGRWLRWLSFLPLEVRLTLPDGTRLLGVHASPGADDGRGLSPDLAEAELSRVFGDADADIVLVGHTHQPTDRTIGATRAVNGGSVSNPITDDLRAAYVVVRGDEHGHDVEHRRVAYDRDLFLKRLADSGHPQPDYIASFQRGEQVRYPSDRPGAPVVAGRSGTTSGG